MLVGLHIEIYDRRTKSILHFYGSINSTEIKEISAGDYDENELCITLNRLNETGENMVIAASDLTFNIPDDYPKFKDSTDFVQALETEENKFYEEQDSFLIERCKSICNLLIQIKPDLFIPFFKRHNIDFSETDNKLILTKENLSKMLSRGNIDILDYHCINTLNLRDTFHYNKTYNNLIK